jgi:hypothetical protein
MLYELRGISDALEKDQDRSRCACRIAEIDTFDNLLPADFFISGNHYLIRSWIIQGYGESTRGLDTLQACDKVKVCIRNIS